MAVRFARLGIAGFKSFADAVSLEILPGLTGIVGPNGCGKSNVTEALRWAMGEGNARTMRGEGMDDVIFSGTAHRAARNLAEVSLTLEEAEAGALPPPFTNQAELQVVRRIERGGGSQYRVNGREARARDVQTLFADLATGARSSGMVSQGRVAALVNARPDERRMVLEEAAGITGLHARRAEAETRLRAAEQNLVRAQERRDDLMRQQDALARQARQAARYRTVAEAALHSEAALLALLQARAGAARAAAHTAHAAALAAAAAAEATVATAQSGHAAAEAAVPPRRGQEAATRTNLERARIVHETARAARTQADANLATARAREAQLARDLAHAQAVLADADAADARLVAERERLAHETDAHPALESAAAAEAAQAAAALLEADEAAALAASAAAEASARADGAHQALQQAEARLRRAEEAAARIAADHAQAAAQAIAPDRLAEAATALEAARLELDQARAAQAAADMARSEAAPRAAAARDEAARLDAARQRLAAEAGALAEVLAVRDNERWPPMVDRVAVPPGLEAALGAALGTELAAADDPKAARHWRALPALAVPPGAGTALLERMEAPPLLARALGGVFVVDTEAEGDAAQPGLRPGQSLVSPQGALWRWDGYTVRAGTPTEAAVRLQQRNRLAGLQRRLAEATAAADQARTASAAATRTERDAAILEQEARHRRTRADQAEAAARTHADGLRTRAEAAAARLAAIEASRDQARREADTARIAASAAREAAAALPDPAALRAAATAARAAVAAARARDQAAHRAFDALQRTHAARTTRLGSIGREREDRALRATDLAGRVTDLEARLHEAAREITAHEAAPTRADHHAAEAARALSEAEAAHAAAAAALHQAEQDTARAAAALRTAEQSGWSAREATLRAEAALDAAQDAVTTATARALEREGALPEALTPTDLSPQAEDRARARLQRLLRERDEIGPVNLRAEIEHAALEEEAASIGRDSAELETAIAKLRGSIGHLNREGRERLSAVFHEVDRQFQALFARLFGGGRAHLALVGSDDPLEAGLEIYAQPPGKKLAALALLSGGEQAMTALSLVFAVFRCNPAPLCVLDEVDAPLDDANVDRLCALLADIAAETGTRFLVVTHHQLTMARMDRLYGVTMQERGVSRLLSVDLARASSMVDQVAAE